MKILNIAVCAGLLSIGGIGAGQAAPFHPGSGAVGPEAQVQLVRGGHGFGRGGFGRGGFGHHGFGGRGGFGPGRFGHHGFGGFGHRRFGGFGYRGGFGRPFGYGYGYRRRYYGGYGPGLGLGFATGALLGGALAAPAYAPAPYYGGVAVQPDLTSYCLRKYRSFDPRSGTYLGYDGRRHACVYP